MVKFLAIAWLVTIGFLVISILVNVILSILLRRKRIEKIGKYNKSEIEKRRYREKNNEKKRKNEEKIEKTEDPNSVLDILDDVLSNNDN